MKKILFLVLLLSMQPVFALLSPLDQSIAELRELMNSPQLEYAFPRSQRIMSILADEQGYLVSSQSYQMRVEVQYQLQDRPGPAAYRLIFHTPTELILTK